MSKGGTGFVSLTVFAFAMALVEAACVVTLKRLYFPEGWVAPFHPIPESGVRLEQWREVATLVMIGAIASLGRPPFRIALARGLWVFGLWDLLYYAFLRLWTGFPKSLADLDLVFLVPRPWTAPVWSACLVALACTVCAQALSRKGGG